MATSPYLLGKLQYTYSPAQRLATGEGAYGQMEDYRQKYAQRGNYRMAIEEGAALPYGPLEKLNADGSWSPVNDPNIDYDPRQTPDVLDSNERRRFVQGFMEAPDSYDIAKKSLQTVATNNGWKEPPRKEGTTLLSLVSDIAPYVGLLTGGVGALNGLSGLIGNSGALGAIGGTDPIALAAADAHAGLIPGGVGASELMPSLIGNDAIETMANVMNHTGTTTFTDGARALGYDSPEQLLSSVNPSWVNTASSLIPHSNPSATPSAPSSAPSSASPQTTTTATTATAATGTGAGSGLLNSLTNNPASLIPLATSAAGLLGAATQTQEDTPYNPAPINQSIVNQFGRVPTGQNINYQDFYSLGLPQGLLDSRIRRLGGLIG